MGTYAKWTVKAVMYYYGEWIENEECALDLMNEVRSKTPNFSKVPYASRMRALRDLLMVEYGHTDIPFTTKYKHEEQI